MKFNKTNITKLLIWIQDHCDIQANAAATKAIKNFKLRKLHQKLTKNPDDF